MRKPARFCCPTTNPGSSSFITPVGEYLVPPGTSIPWDQGISGRVYQTGEPVISRDVRTDSRHFAGVDNAIGHTTRDMVTVPLKQWGGQTIGVLNVINKKHGAFDERDLTVLTVISSFAALAIRQTQQFEESRLAEVARMLGNVGHDLKNLITPIISCSGLLKEELDELFETLPDEASGTIESRRQMCTESIDAILKTSDRIRNRVKEMADCVKGRSSPPRFEACAVEAVIEDVFASLRIPAEESKISLETEFLDRMPTIEADSGRLYTAFYNLVINAIAEGRPGGYVRIIGRREDDHVVLIVTDDGGGMSPEVRESLFRPTRSAGGRAERGWGPASSRTSSTGITGASPSTAISAEGQRSPFVCRSYRPKRHSLDRPVGERLLSSPTWRRLGACRWDPRSPKNSKSP